MRDTVRPRSRPRSRPLRRAVAVGTALLTLAVTGFTATACGGASSASGGSDGTLRVGVIGSKAKLSGPAGFLHEQGKLLPELKKAGFKRIEVFPFPNGPDLNQALVGGNLDVASYGDTPALVARGSGLETRLIEVAGVDLDASVVVKPNGPRTLKELAGKKVGVQRGSYIHRYLLGALHDAAVEPSETTHIYSADIEAPLERGDIAAAAMPQANAEVFRSKGYRIINQITKDHPDYAGTRVTVSTDGFLEDHPKFLGIWQKALVDGSKAAKTDWEGYLDFSTTLSDFPKKLVKLTTLRSQLPDTPFPARGLELLKGTKEFLLKEDFVKKDFSVDDWLVDDAV